MGSAPFFMNQLHCGRFTLSLERPRVMGIVNITPDSFSDGGRFADSAAAIAHAQRLIDEGADLIDLGAQSTRPRAAPIGAEEEWARLAPVLEALAEVEVPLSIDTFHAEVMERALAAGASMINDVWALRRPGTLAVVARHSCAVCLMHMQNDPATMQSAPAYEDVVTEVRDFLKERVDAAEAAGIARERIVLDPGFGFGKTLRHNYQLLSGLGALCRLGFPVLVGVSRKSMVTLGVNMPIEDRVPGSIAAALAAVARGARIVRVHDVRATVNALKVWEMVDNCASQANRPH